MPASRSSLPLVCFSLFWNVSAPNGLSGCKSRVEELEGGQEQGRRISGCSQSDCSSCNCVRVYAAVWSVLLRWHSVIVYMERVLGHNVNQQKSDWANTLTALWFASELPHVASSYCSHGEEERLWIPGPTVNVEPQKFQMMNALYVISVQQT